MDLPNLPVPPKEKNAILASHLTRKRLKVLIHVITGQLKVNGTKISHIFLPFRSKIKDSSLELLLSNLFPKGELISNDESTLTQIISQFDDFTLICCLKYFWSRLPNNEVVGWDIYLLYKRKEKEANYPKDAFFTIMPKCLSPAHASIFYDFMDLLMSVASNSQYNNLSGRKIAKMASIWAFSSNNTSKSVFYDATKENNFMEGLQSWKETSGALFHLLLSFLRASLPESDADCLKLPKTLQTLIISNSYPPDLEDSIKSIITIPCVLIKSTKTSSSPYELLSKARKTLTFDKKNQFRSIENYTILKNIFQKNSTEDIIETLTDESKRVLARISEPPIDSNFNLYPGWSHNQPEPESDIPSYSQFTITDVSIQDYYIWTWLSTLGSDQTSKMKKLFGRSIVVEAGLKGFQRWLIITEQTMSTSEYLNIFKEPSRDSYMEYGGGSSHSDKRGVPHNEIRSMIPAQSGIRSMIPSDDEIKSRIPPPVPTKDGAKPHGGLLPDISFAEDDYKLDVPRPADLLIDESEPNSDYRDYLKSLNELDVDKFANNVSKSSTSKPSVSTNYSTNRRPPPQAPVLDELHSSDLNNFNQNHVNHINSYSPERLVNRTSRSPDRYIETNSPSKSFHFENYEDYALYEAGLAKSEVEDIDIRPNEDEHHITNNNSTDGQIPNERASNDCTPTESIDHIDNRKQKSPVIPQVPKYPPYSSMLDPIPGPIKPKQTETREASSLIPTVSPSKNLPAIDFNKFGEGQLAGKPLPRQPRSTSPTRNRYLNVETSPKHRSTSPNKKSSRMSTNSSNTVEEKIQNTIDQIQATMENMSFENEDQQLVIPELSSNLSSSPRPMDKEARKLPRVIRSPDIDVRYSPEHQAKESNFFQNAPESNSRIEARHEELDRRQNLSNADESSNVYRQSHSLSPNHGFNTNSSSVPNGNNSSEHEQDYLSLPTKLTIDRVNGNRSPQNQSTNPPHSRIPPNGAPRMRSPPNGSQMRSPPNGPQMRSPPSVSQMRPPNGKHQLQPGHPQYPPYGVPVHPVGYPPIPPASAGPPNQAGTPTQPLAWPPYGYYPPPPPNGYYPPPPNGYYPPPNGYYPPPQPGYYPAPNYPPQGYGPPPGAHPPPQPNLAPPPGAKSNNGLSMVPAAGKFNKNTTKNKVNMRHALNEGFGI